MFQKPQYQSFLILIVFLILIPISLNAATYEDGRTEYDDLKEIYQTGMPQKLREIFDSYSKLNPDNQKDQEKLAEVKEYLPLFQEKFIVGGMLKFDDGRYCNAPSYVIGIFISPKKMESWDVYLYKVGPDKYEICKISWDDLSDSRKSRYYYWRKFKSYWN